MSDLISREYMKSLGATCIASRSKDGTLFPIVAIDELPPADPTHETPSNTLGTLDCVDRNEAIKNLEQYKDLFSRDDGDRERYVLTRVIKELKAMPSVQPEFSNNSKELEKNSKELENKNGELISRQDAIGAICSVCGNDCDKSKFLYDAPQDEQMIICSEHYVLTQLPSAQKTGKWIYEEMASGYDWKCDKCGCDVKFTTSFCPYCGADMIGEQDD